MVDFMVSRGGIEPPTYWVRVCFRPWKVRGDHHSCRLGMWDRNTSKWYTHGTPEDISSFFFFNGSCKLLGYMVRPARLELAAF